MNKARTLGLGAVSLAAAALLASCAQAPSAPGGGVERMYVFDCGENQTNYVSPWSPGAEVGKS